MSYVFWFTVYHYVELQIFSSYAALESLSTWIQPTCMLLLTWIFIRLIYNIVLLKIEYCKFILKTWIPIFICSLFVLYLFKYLCNIYGIFMILQSYTYSITYVNMLTYCFRVFIRLSYSSYCIFAQFLQIIKV